MSPKELAAHLGVPVTVTPTHIRVSLRSPDGWGTPSDGGWGFVDLAADGSRVIRCSGHGERYRALLADIKEMGLFPSQGRR